jgi:hypothetical protein
MTVGQAWIMKQCTHKKAGELASVFINMEKHGLGMAG